MITTNHQYPGLARVDILTFLTTIRMLQKIPLPIFAAPLLLVIYRCGKPNTLPTSPTTCFSRSLR